MSTKINEEKQNKLYQGFLGLVRDIFGSQKFAEAKLKDGTVIYYEGEAPVEGMEVWVIPSDGSEKLPAPDGVHALEDGMQIEVVGGKIVKIAAPAAMEDTPTTPQNLPATEVEAIAKRVIESTVKETVYSAIKPLEENLKSATESFAAFKVESEKTIEALRAESKTLTEAVAAAKAEAAEVKAKFSAFSAETQKLFAQYGAKPQVPPAPKPAEFRSNDTSNPAKLPPEEWRKKFIG